ncbi:uncharacterized protein G2W53_017430 [Senna tora]|uniref:Uncharacterized protein n=1 Tax=Senna tora TaxID=362788 RepID=A0A834WNZ0_9FABA|nr:uncharacterized protein G2W53_017430 [Senna tora]
MDLESVNQKSTTMEVSARMDPLVRGTVHSPRVSYGVQNQGDSSKDVCKSFIEDEPLVIYDDEDVLEPLDSCRKSLIEKFITRKKINSGPMENVL